MNIWYRRRGKRGFTLVELLAVVLVLAVLAAVAIPLYINTRRSSAARACKQNLATYATALSASATRNGAYPDDAVIADPSTDAYVAGTADTGLVGAPEGLATAGLSCPLDGDLYTYAGGGAGASCTITCPNAATHALLVGVAADYSRTLNAPASEAGIP